MRFGAYIRFTKTSGSRRRRWSGPPRRNCCQKVCSAPGTCSAWWPEQSSLRAPRTSCGCTRWGRAIGRRARNVGLSCEDIPVVFDRQLIEAALALELIPPAGMPELAWDALEAGFDGRAIRHLAALEQPTYFEIAPLLSKAKAEMGLSEVTKGEAALRIGKLL